MFANCLQVSITLLSKSKTLNYFPITAANTTAKSIPSNTATVTMRRILGLMASDYRLETPACD